MYSCSKRRSERWERNTGDWLFADWLKSTLSRSNPIRGLWLYATRDSRVYNAIMRCYMRCYMRPLSACLPHQQNATKIMDIKIPMRKLEIFFLERYIIFIWVFYNLTAELLDFFFLNKNGGWIEIRSGDLRRHRSRHRLINKFWAENFWTTRVVFFRKSFLICWNFAGCRIFFFLNGQYKLSVLGQFDIARDFVVGLGEDGWHELLN